jgi:hypothetical protein
MSILIPDTVYKITCNESENIFQDEVFIKQFKHIACTESELDITVGGRSNEKDSPQDAIERGLELIIDNLVDEKFVFVGTENRPIFGVGSYFRLYFWIGLNEMQEIQLYYSNKHPRGPISFIEFDIKELSEFDMWKSLQHLKNNKKRIIKSILKSNVQEHKIK